MSKLNQNATDYLILLDLVYTGKSMYMTDALCRLQASVLTRCPACRHYQFEHREGCELLKAYNQIIEKHKFFGNYLILKREAA